MVTVTKRSLEEPQEARKVKVIKTKKQDSPASSATDFKLIMAPQLALIEASSRTPFEKKVWALLCQIPQGSFSTYGIMAAHIKSSPRAVGNALRRNPFAPEVPCHRVVATGGALGGFKGKWPKNGEGITLDEKRMLLKGEGVRWDVKGKVIGTPFGGFT
ncbi:hypothetical protein ACHAPU_005947 [Fusarium lateritium]